MKLRSLSGRALRLDSFNPIGLQFLLDQVGWKTELLTRRTGLFVDCVFGLPEQAWRGEPGQKTLHRYFKEAAGLNIYGLKVAARYFDEILQQVKTGETFPVRRCERLANANSVFRTHPFQKNIQCGTFRIWSDLGRAEKPWLNIRYFTPVNEAELNRPWLFESYPSLFWRDLFGLKTRKLSELRAAILREIPDLKLARADWELLATHPDIADAAVLALGGYLLGQRGRLTQNAPSRKKWRAIEGWIVGLNELS